MRVSTSITSDDLAGIGARAAELEARGFDELQAQENRHDPFIPLTLAAAATSTIGLATNVAISFPRSPMVAATTSWDLHTLSGGRFTLGLGTQIRPHNERRFSVPWSAPAPRMREYVQSMRAIFHTWETGERLRFEGDHYTFTLMTPNFTPPPLGFAPPRLHIAAVGPRMLHVAGTVCDGVNLHPFCTPRYLTGTILPALERALTESGRTRSDLRISGGGFIATGADDEAVDAAAEFARRRIGFYGSTPSYWPVFEAHDLELGPKLNALSKQGAWDSMTEAIDDDVLDLFCVRGTHDDIAPLILDRFGDLIDGIGLDNDAPGELIERLQQG